MFPVEIPFKTYTGLDGKPLSNGYVYFGEPDQNPITQPVTVYWDAACTIPAAQPLRTVNGYLMRNGTPANVYSSIAYSELVNDSKGLQVFYSGNSDEFGISALLQQLSKGSGAERIGSIQTGVGAELRSVQDKLRDIVHIKDFGGAFDGVADDAAAWQRAIDSGHRTIDARNITSAILSQVNLASNQTILMNGARIITAGSSLKTLNAVGKTRFNLIGPFEIVGDLTSNPGTGVTAAAIYIEDCSKFRIDSPTILDIKGYGIRLDPGANTTSRADHGTISNARIDNCVWGWHDRADQGAEYCTVLNLHVTNCWEAGIETSAGNTSFIGGQCVDNRKDGFRLQSGFNDAHGIVSGMNINHNVRYNLLATEVTNGQSFIGCHFYGNGSSSGALFLDRCKGIVLDGGHLDCWVYNDKDINSGQNIIRNMYCPGSYGGIILAGGPNPGLEQLWFDSCWGAGAYAGGVTINDPSPVYALVRRSPGTYQPLPGATNLIFPVEISDRRLAHDTATGITTIPAGQAGLYRITATVMVTGTNLVPDNSFIDLKVSGSSITLALPTAFGTSRLAFVIAPPDFQLNAGDTIALNATVDGTSPQFGDGTWVSHLSIERIA